MGRNLKFLILIFLLTILYGVYYRGIPALINLPERANLVEQTVLKETGYKISLINPDLKMGFTPSIWIKADNFAILFNFLFIDAKQSSFKSSPKMLFGTLFSSNFFITFC